MSTAAITSLTFRVVRVRSFDALTQLSTAWNRLAGDVPFRRWEWCSAWWKHCSRHDDELFVLLVLDGDDSIVGIAPWYLRNTIGAGRSLCFLGHDTEPTDLSLLAVPGLERTIAVRIAAWLCCEGAGHWDLLLLDGVNADDEACSRLADALQARWHTVGRRPQCQSLAAALPRRFDRWTSQLAEVDRELVEQVDREYIATGRAVLRTAICSDDVRRGLDLLQKLATSEGRASRPPGRVASEAFHQSAARQFLSIGLLHLQWTELDGQPIAAEYGFVGDDTIYVYHHTWAAGAGGPVATLHSVLALRRAVTEGYRHLLVRGTTAVPVLRTHAATRPLLHYYCAARSWGAHCYLASWRAQQLAVRACQRLLRALRRQ
ncbi:MAG: GNAT family N-acetyltransferase [Planctomycetes bacterium]|nr:GNAT family N-acetyltransferase [Planctomycetota bacterium]